MLKFVLLVALVGVAAAQVKFIQIKSQTNDIKDDGSYQWSYQSEDGTQAEEKGYLKPGSGKDEPALQVEGSNSYTSPEGTPIQTSYVANENGYQPSGPHLPTPHPIPEAILRSIEFNAKNANPNDEGQYKPS